MDGKKKKNKKKKGSSQSKLVDASVGEVAVAEQGNESDAQLNHIPQVPSSTDVQSVGVSESDIELDRHKVYEERFVKLQEEVRQLEDERNHWLQKESSLDGKITLLQSDVESCIINKAGLEEKLKILQHGNDILIQKEAILEDRVKHIEGVKDSWISKDILISELASKVEDINLTLLEQVKELNEDRDSLLQENAKLRESITMMESRVQRIETEAFLSRSSTKTITETPKESTPEFHSEAAPPQLVEKRETEKAEFVEKVKEMHVESPQRTKAADHPSPSELESSISIEYPPSYTEHMYGSGDRVPSPTGDHDPFGIPNDVEDFGSLNGTRQGHVLGIENSRISEDIVSVPLDDIYVEETREQQAAEEDMPLPISDAPLIGAPFRLISFFAKYVSGADLVDQDSGRSG